MNRYSIGSHESKPMPNELKPEQSAGPLQALHNYGHQRQGTGEGNQQSQGHRCHGGWSIGVIMAADRPPLVQPRLPWASQTYARV